jgi:hypothetical protein
LLAYQGGERECHVQKQKQKEKEKRKRNKEYKRESKRKSRGFQLDDQQQVRKNKNKKKKSSRRPSFPSRPWVMVRSDPLTPARCLSSWGHRPSQLVLPVCD